MQKEAKTPTLEEIKSFLTEYGWQHRETTAGENQTIIIAPYTLEKESRGILVSFRIEGEFVMVATVGFLKGLQNTSYRQLLNLNDQLKLVKLFSNNSNQSETFAAELGFELWGEAWNQSTFYAFMDMLCLGIEKVKDSLDESKVSYKTEFVIYS